MIVKTFDDKYGTIQLVLNDEDTHTLLVIPRGFISLSLMRRYVRFVIQLMPKPGNTFNHIVDTSSVTFANPLNPVLLRQISKLKCVNLYIVIVPSRILRFFVRLTKWINKPDYVFKSLREVNDLLELKQPLRRY